VSDGGAESAYHLPVLRDEVTELLVTDPDGLYVDGTLGGGGHARAILARLGQGGRLLGVDRDPEALAACRESFGETDGRLLLAQGNFAELPHLLAEHGLGGARGILLDLGVSSRHLDAGERGFSFLRPGPLDMRMGPDADRSAADLVNTLPEGDLARIFREFGEEPRARRAARAVAEARNERPIESTQALAAVIERALGRRGGKHPATRIFQALRIAVNRELEALDAFLGAFEELLEPGGRVAVISYHSLEDRMVKQAFRERTPHCICPPRAPRCVCGLPGTLRAVTRKAVRPG
jgi:16S rRNA (cytosine1402-N4)-methyltransferase